MTLAAQLQRGFAWLGVVFGLLLTLLAGALVFVMITTGGAQLAFSLAERLSGGMVIAQGIDGRLLGPLRVQHFELHLKAVDVTVEDAVIDPVWLALLGNRIEVTQAQVASVKVVIKPTPPDGTPPISQLPFALLVRAASVGELRIIDGDSAPIALDAIELAGSWRGPQVQIAHAAVTTPWVGRVQLDGKATLHGDGVDVEVLHSQGFAAATLDGHFGYGKPSDLRLRWQHIRWPPAADIADGKSDFDSGGGEAHWTGLLDAYRYQINGALALPGFALQLQARGRGSLSSLQIEQLQAQGLEGQLQAAASINWHGGLRIDGHGNFSGINPQALNAELVGRLNGSFDAQTRISDGRPDVRFSAQLLDSTLRNYPLKLVTSGHYAGERLNFDVLKLGSGRVSVVASGQVLPTLAAQAQISAPNLADAWPGLSGTLNGNVQAEGELRMPKVIAELQAQKLRYEDFQLDHLQLNADVDPRHQLDLDLVLGELVAGTEIKNARLAIHGPAAAHRIELSAGGAPGEIKLQADGALDVDQPAWRGELQSARIVPAALAAWTLQQPAALAFSRDQISVAPLCWSADQAQLCTSYASAKGVQHVELSLAQFSLAYLQPLMPGGAQVNVVLHGKASAAIGERGLQDLRADFASEAGTWQLGGLPPIDLQPARLRINDDEQGTLLDVLLPFAGGELALDARLAPGPVFVERVIDGHLRARLPDLAWLHQINVEIAEAAGTLDADLKLSGTLAKPVPQGHLQLNDGRLRLVTPGIELKDVSARIDGDGESPLQVQAAASSGDGKLTLSGSINPWHDPLALDLKLTGDKFQAVNVREARVLVSPDLRVHLADQLLDVSGVITVPKADITPKSLGDGSVSSSSDQVLVGRDLGAQQKRDLRISADVTLKLGDDVQFEGFGLKTQLGGSVQAFEQPGVPTRARGEINLVGGHYKAYGQDLTIETGKLLFNDGPVTEPALELRATRKPTDDITVGLYVRGTLKKPEFNLFSTPAMPQDQQLGWLILGRAINETTSSADKSAVGGAATSLGLAGGAWLAQQLGNKIGIDEVTAGTQPGQTADQAMFTVGKYLSPKLFIAYGVGLFQPGHTFRLQYKLGGGFKVQTETGVESGGDLLYTIERK